MKNIFTQINDGSSRDSPNDIKREGGLQYDSE